MSEEKQQHLLEEEETSETSVDGENDCLAKDSPWKTILYLSAGPFLAELVGAAYAIADSFWISKACGQDGLAAMSLCSLLDTLGRAFGMLVSVAASSQFAKLRGEKKSSAIPQVFADLFRLCFILGCIVPTILLPCVKPMLTFFGADSQILQMGFDYLLPLLAGSVVSCLNLLLCGILQSEGRSFLYGAVQITSFCLNMCVFDPLFMIAIKLGMLGAGLATVCAEGCPMIVIAVLFFLGKFDSKTTRKELLSRPSQYTVAALKTGMTQFISHICFNIPSFFSRKYVSSCAEASGNYTENLAAYNVINRVWSIPASYAIAVSIALLPSASYANGASNPGRFISLIIWATVLSFAWCSIAEVGLITLGKYIALIFGTTETFVHATAEMLRISYMFCFSMGSQYVATSVLQAMQQNIQSIVLSVLTQFLPVPLFGTILYFTSDTHDIFRLMYMYALNDAFSLVVSAGFMIWPIHKLRMAAKVILDHHTDPSSDKESPEGHPAEI